MKGLPGLRALRESKGLSRAQLASLTKTGMAEETVWRYEQGKRNPRLYEAQKLAEALGVSVEDLLREDAPDATTPPATQPASAGDQPDATAEQAAQEA